MSTIPEIIGLTHAVSSALRTVEDARDMPLSDMRAHVGVALADTYEQLKIAETALKAAGYAGAQAYLMAAEQG